MNDYPRQNPAYRLALYFERNLKKSTFFSDFLSKKAFILIKFLLLTLKVDSHIK